MFDDFATPERLEREASDYFFHGRAPAAGEVVVDAGAGSGTEVIAFSRQVGPQGLVVAVEAHPREYARLSALCKLNHLENVLPLQFALMDVEGDVAITDLGVAGSNTVVAVGVEERILVPAETLDGILARHDIPRVDFLKMNIEGAEAQALAGFTGLARTRHVVVACHDFRAEAGRGGEAMRTKARVTELLERAGLTVATRPRDPRPWVRDFLYASRPDP